MKDVPSTAIEGVYSRFGRFQSLRNRRIIVAFYLANLGLLLLVTGLVDSYWPLAPLGAFYAVTTLFLLGSTHGITNLPTDALDEQQVTVRNDGFRMSYWAGVMIALAGGYAISTIHDWDTAFEAGLILAVWGVVTGLPTLVVAWRLPGDPADE